MADPTTTARRALASRFFKLREGGLGRKQMLEEDFVTKDWDDSSRKTFEGLGKPEFKSFVDRLYAGKFDTSKHGAVKTRQIRRQRERQDFAKQQKSLKVGREAAFMDKMDRQRKESAAKFGQPHEVDTPGLDRIAAMQGTKMGTSTAHAGEIAKGVGPQSRRTVTPRSAVHGVEARAHEKAGNKAAAAAARARQFAERAGEPDIRGQAEKQKEREHGRDARAKLLEEKKAKEADAAAAKARAEAERNKPAPYVGP